MELLIFLPLLLALIVPVSGIKIRNLIVISFVVLLSLFSISTFLDDRLYSLTLSHDIHTFLCVADIVLLVYFLAQGIKYRSKLVYALAFVQLILYLGIIYLAPSMHGIDLLSDELSRVMYLVINVVGGAIIIYALEYIEAENFSRLKKNSFIALLLFFLGVMNAIVSTNNIEIFFLLFELTTLCSYLLIRYRGDDIAVKNSLKALWMNQVGGVAILLALVFSISTYNTVYFSELLKVVDDSFLIPIIFLVIAAYVKGAAFPFQNWLLGAMVAPTPVSAILHSATMVKIAPFIVLKLSTAFSPSLSVMVSIFASFVFVGASIMALNRDFFKEILGLSTIALLSLMMALASLPSEEARYTAILLLVFHAISKALLFLQAGILEKVYHLKYISDIDNLVDHAPRTVFFIIIGFASLTLPPFGAFIGKFLGIEAITQAISQNPLYIFTLLGLIVGSVFLVILYFKIITKLLTKEPFKNILKEKLAFKYKLGSNILFISLFIGIFLVSALNVVEVLIPVILIFISPFLLKYFSFKSAPRVKEYNCGEKGDFEVGVYNYALSSNVIQKMMYISIFMIVLHLAIGGGILK
ncbi:proton-conducting transporter membrane subunit [Sulfurimonas sp.]|uniref:proton-conducting transporter transmembrane domain-containing protein n=1 Tax=Sulfurimonas sp. TaxID=2022749 RepID=UPI003563E20D